MFLRTFFDPKLAHNSYLVACQVTGEAIVIDPTGDLDAYLLAAQAEGLRIVAVVETYIHADFVTGSRTLAEQTGATLYLLAAGGDAWQYADTSDYPQRLLTDGDQWRIGTLQLQARYTLGHTLEHLSIVLTDTATTAVPMGVFISDFVLVGDVGRPLPTEPVQFGELPPALVDAEPSQLKPDLPYWMELTQPPTALHPVATFGQEQRKPVAKGRRFDQQPRSSRRRVLADQAHPTWLADKRPHAAQRDVDSPLAPKHLPCLRNLLVD